MATWLKSANFNGANAAHFYIALYYDLTQDINKNKSTITYSLYVGSADGYSASGAASSVKINNAEVASITSIGVNQWAVVGTYTTTVTHNNDGTGSATYSAKVDTNWDIEDAEIASTTFTLPTIPRTSTIQATDAAVNSATTINVTKASSSFKNTITYSFDGLTGTIVSDFAGTSYSWIVPTTFYSKLSTTQFDVGKTCTLTCTTKNGSTTIGTSTTTFQVTVAANNTTRPTVSATFTLDSTTKSLNGNNNTYVIKGITDVTVAMTATPQSVSGTAVATIASKSTTCGDGQSITANGTINNVGSANFLVTATDSRGISNSTTYNLTLVNYVMLTLNPTFYRTSPTNNTVALTFNGAYYKGNLGNGSATANTLAVKYRYKLSTSSSWGSYTTLSTTIGNDGTYSNGSSPITLGTSFDYTKEYDFEIVATDKVGSVTKAQKVLAGKPIFDWGKSDFQFNVPVKLSSGNQILDYSTVSGDRIKLGSSKFWDSTGIKHGSTALNSVLDAKGIINSVYNYTLTRVTTTLTANAWKDLYTAKTTASLPAGTYLIIADVITQFTGSGSGVHHKRITIDGTEVARHSPFGNAGYPGSSPIIGVVTFSSAATHTVQGQAYTPASFTVPNDGKIYFIRLI
jgi:hypothetical protein